jgi:hypothetical protein
MVISTQPETIVISNAKNFKTAYFWVPTPLAFVLNVSSPHRPYNGSTCQSLIDNRCQRKPRRIIKDFSAFEETQKI